MKPRHLGGLARDLVIALGLVGPMFSLPREACANEPSFDGSWTMSATTESFVVVQWGKPCGPPPVSGTMLAPGPATIRGDQGELVVAAQRRELRTDECLDAMPNLVRESHTRGARSWRTRCATPPDDSRHAVVNTAFFVAPGNDTISIAETGRYEFSVSGKRCVADVKRAADLSRNVVVGASAVAGGAPSASGAAWRAVPEKAASVSPAPMGICSRPGAPVRLEVSPSRKLLRLGDTFGFRGVVVDANGCLATTSIQWTVGAIAFHDGQSHAARPAIDASGRLTVPRVDFADATFDVMATAAGREARASVEATSAANYEALLAQSGLDSNGQRDEPSVVNLATNAIGASRARAEDGASRRRMTFAAIVSGLSLLLGIVAIVGARRARRARQAELLAEARHAEKMRVYEQRKRENEAQHAERLRAHIQSVAIAQQQAASAAARGIRSGPVFCPSCRREFPSAGSFCPFDANRLITIAGHEALLAGPAGGICPVCKRGFNPGVRVCPHDGEDLVPSVVANAEAGESSPAARGKICPTCGGRFEGASAFCVKDGTQLVPLN